MPKNASKPKTAPEARRRTMTDSEARRLFICNSMKAPTYIEVQGRRFWWTGIGLVDLGPAKGDEVLIVDG